MLADVRSVSQDGRFGWAAVVPARSSPWRRSQQPRASCAESGHQPGEDVDGAALGHLRRGAGRHEDVGLDADPVEAPAGRREVAADGQLEGRAVRERGRFLHGALPIGAGADDHGTVAVLERARHHLGGASRRGVHEHDERGRGVAALERVEGTRRGAAALVGNDRSSVEEDRRHRDGLVQQAAREIGRASCRERVL